MDLERALESRGVIEQAKGIIMGTHHVDADRAFRILIQDSQRSNVKLRVIAQQYIDGAIDPRQATNKPATTGTGPPSAPHQRQSNQPKPDERRVGKEGVRTCKLGGEP